MLAKFDILEINIMPLLRFTLIRRIFAALLQNVKKIGILWIKN